MATAGIGFSGFESLRKSAGLGYVIIPPGLDRAGYVDQCYRTNKVSLIQETGELLFDVPVDAASLPLIKFPAATGLTGTSVVWVNLPGYEQPVIVAVLPANNELSSTGEGQQHQQMVFAGQKASLTLNAKVPAVNLEAQGPGAQLNLFALAPENDALVSTFVQGDATSWASGEVRTEAGKSVSLAALDPGSGADRSRLELGPAGTTLKSPKISFGEGAQPLLLGTATVQLLSDVLTALTKLTVPTANGPSGVPLNSPEFLRLRAGLEQLKSTLSFTD